MNVLVPGGAGYIGAMLVPWLLVDGHKVTAYDTFWFGPAGLSDNGNLTVIKADLRDEERFSAACKGMDAVIYLASLSSDFMCQVYPSLHKAVNVDVVPPVLAAAKRAGVRRFIYASSVAAYGSTECDARESDALRPTTMYAQAKKASEEVVLAQNTKDFTTCVTRSASVCGTSGRQRFDLTVNQMVRDAMKKGSIVVNGGSQKRCHIHMQDICRAYRMLLDIGRNVLGGQAYNFVAENATVLSTANLVSEVTGAKVLVGPATDDRSYTVDGTKAREALGFVPRKTVRDAIVDLKVGFDSDALGITTQFKDSLTDLRYMNRADGLA
jgi:nucleoside-diphosphate-sugar epimerase